MCGLLCSMFEFQLVWTLIEYLYGLIKPVWLFSLI